MHSTLLALLALALLIFSGCAVGPDFKSPHKNIPVAWTGIDNATARQPSAAIAGQPSYIAWWQTFNDPVLSKLVEQALAANLDLIIAQSRVRQARATRTITAAGLWPQLDAGGSYTRSHQGQQQGSSELTGANGISAMEGSREQRIDLFQAGLDAVWELDIFGGTRRSVEAATADIQAAEEDRRDVMVTLIGEVGTTYLSLRGFQQQAAIARKNLSAQEHTAEITRKRYEAGLANGLDMANALGQAAATRAQIPVLETGAQQAIYSLSVLLAREPAALVAELVPPGDIPAGPAGIPVGLPSELVRRRPDIRRAEAQVHAATANIGVATADLFPKFALTGSFGLRGDEWQTLGSSHNHVWSVGPSASWPIFAAGRISANIRVQNELQAQALAGYDKTVLTALKDVESALVAYANEQRHHAALTAAVANGRKAVDIATRLYTAGRSDFLNVLVSQRALFSYEDAWVQSSRNLATDLIALYKALGGGWEYSPPGQSASAQ